MKTKISLLLLFLSTFCFGQTLPKIDSYIENEMKSNNAAALAVAIIDSGKVVHINAYGYRDLKNKRKATIHTPFHIASVSKTVTNLAVFKLVESEQLDLNTDINKYLPFEVKNPHYPNDIITIRELLNHRSGIKDNFEIYKSYWLEPMGDINIELKSFLKDYLVAGGKDYRAENFESKLSYQSFSYSNTGVTILALIIETVSGMKYEDYCQESIFEPLGMKNTSWFLKNLDSNLVAKTYVYQDSLGLTFKGHNGYPDYPAGQLRTSIYDYSILLKGYLNAENSNFILNANTTSKITPTPSISHEGFYTWFLYAINNNIYYGHAGGDTGVRTRVIMDVKKKRGIVLFANSEFKILNLIKEIEKQMWSK